MSAEIHPCVKIQPLMFSSVTRLSYVTAVRHPGAMVKEEAPVI